MYVYIAILRLDMHRCVCISKLYIYIYDQQSDTGVSAISYICIYNQHSDTGVSECDVDQLRVPGLRCARGVFAHLIYIYIYIYICVCVYIYTYIHICIYS